jgi:hypothetical protein
LLGPNSELQSEDSVAEQSGVAQGKDKTPWLLAYRRLCWPSKFPLGKQKGSQGHALR